MSKVDIKKITLILIFIVMLSLTGCSLKIEMNVKKDYSGQFEFSINKSDLYTREYIEKNIEKYIKDENEKYGSKVYSLNSIEDNNEKLDILIDFKNLKDYNEKTAFTGTYSEFLDFNISVEELGVILDNNEDIVNLEEFKNKKNLSVIYINKSKLKNEDEIEKVSFEINIPGKIKYYSDGVEIESENSATFLSTRSAIFYVKDDPIMDYIITFSIVFLIILLVYILYNSYSKERENCIKCDSKLLKDTKYCGECGEIIKKVNIDFDKLNKKILFILLLLTVLPFGGYKLYKSFDFSIVKSDLSKEVILESIDGKALYEEGYESQEYKINKDNILEFDISNSDKDGEFYKTSGNIKAKSENLIIDGKFNLIHTYINGKWKVVMFSLEKMEKIPFAGPTEAEIKDIMSQIYSINLSETGGENSITLGDDVIQKISVEKRISDIKNNKEHIDFNMNVLKDLVTISINISGDFVFTNEKWNLSNYEIYYDTIDFKYNDENLKPPENENDLQNFISGKSVGIKNLIIEIIPKEFKREKFSKFTITEINFEKVGTNVIYEGYMEYNDEEFEYKGDYILSMNCEENNEWNMEFEVESDKVFKTATSMQLLEKVIGVKTELNGENITIKEEFISDFKVEERNKIGDNQEIIVSFNYKDYYVNENLKFKIMYIVGQFETTLEEPDRVNY